MSIVRFKIWTLAAVCLLYITAASQTTFTPPFKRFPSIPAFKLLLPDSINLFTKSDLKKNRPVLIMLFNPECEHCRHETEAILQRMDEFKKIQIVMATMMPMNMLRAFCDRYSLERYPSIIAGKDMENLLPSFYAISNLPLLALYDRKGRLIEAVEGSLPVDQLLAKFDQN